MSSPAPSPALHSTLSPATARASRVLVAAAALLLPGVVLAPVWPLAGLGAQEDDILYYLPSRAYFGESVRAGQPLWLNPWTGLDRPFLADPQSAVFYPATWLFAVLPPLAAYAVGLWAHYGLALAGMYRLLRGHRYRRGAAVLGGVVFAFGGFMLAHRAHFAMQHAAAWAPWVLWALQRYAQRGRTDELALAGFLGAMQCFAGHVQIAALTALGSLAYVLALCGPAWRFAGRWLLTWALAGALFAVQLLPTLAYVAECTRSDRTYFDFTEQSWHPASAIGFLLPMFFGQRVPNFFDVPYWGPSHQCEQFIYVGIVPLLLALLALRSGWATPDRRAWILLAGVAVLTALGRLGPVCPLLYWLPGASVFRVPARAVLLLQIALAGLAAGSAHQLCARMNPGRVRLRAVLQRWTQRPAWSVALLLLLLALLGVAIALLSGPGGTAWSALALWKPNWWLPAGVMLGAFILLGHVARRWRQPGLIWLLPLFAVLDLGVIGWTIDVPPAHPTASALLSPLHEDDWPDEIRRTGGRLWVLTPRDSPDDKPGQYIDSLAKKVANVNMLAGVASATDYGPLQPKVYDRIFPHAPWGETIETDPQPRLDDPAWRRPLNIRWILLCSDRLVAPPGCRHVATAPTGYRLYENTDAAGMSFMLDAAHPGIVVYEPASSVRFVTRVVPWPPALPRPGEGGPAVVVVSRLALPGWTASAGGVPLEIRPALGGLLSVVLPSFDPVEIEWRYSPPGLASGAAISLTAVAVLALLLLNPWSRPRRSA